MLNACTLVDSGILEGARNFWRWDPAEEVGHWQHASKGYIRCLVLSFIPASCLTLGEESSLQWYLASPWAQNQWSQGLWVSLWSHKLNQITLWSCFVRFFTAVEYIYMFLIYIIPCLCRKLHIRIKVITVRHHLVNTFLGAWFSSVWFSSLQGHLPFVLQPKSCCFRILTTNKRLKFYPPVEDYPCSRI